jgi:hypothetical protein
MEQKIGVIGTGGANFGLHEIKDAIIESEQHGKVVVIDNPEPRKYAYVAPPELKSIDHDSKGFVCSGKHRYEIEAKDGITQWICQCGRNVND